MSLFYKASLNKLDVNVTLITTFPGPQKKAFLTNMETSSLVLYRTNCLQMQEIQMLKCNPVRNEDEINPSEIYKILAFVLSCDVDQQGLHFLLCLRIFCQLNRQLRYEAVRTVKTNSNSASNTFKNSLVFQVYMFHNNASYFKK